MKSFKIFYDNILKQRNKYSMMAVWWDKKFKSGFKTFCENFKRNKNKAKSNIRLLILHKCNKCEVLGQYKVLEEEVVELE